MIFTGWRLSWRGICLLFPHTELRNNSSLKGTAKNKKFHRAALCSINICLIKNLVMAMYSYSKLVQLFPSPHRQAVLHVTRHKAGPFMEENSEPGILFSKTSALCKPPFNEQKYLEAPPPKLSTNIMCHSPSKLPFSEQAVISFSYVSLEGWKTNTPELKQSGQPGSGAADSSSLSNNSSMLDKTC